jgi:hypothetical protein
MTTQGAAAAGVGNRRDPHYVIAMDQRSSRLGMIGTIAIVVPLFAILAVTVWYAAGAWTRISGPPMPAAGYVAMALGVIFSLVVGCGLMALLFYSSRHGYDEPSVREDDDS